MKKLMIVGLVLVFGLCAVGNVVAGDAKQTCIDLCVAAAADAAKDLKAATAEMNKKDGKFVKGDVYVFMVDMKGVMLAHPIKPALVGKNMLENDKVKALFQQFIDVAKGKDGKGWADYKWPKPGEKDPSDKSSYILKVNDNVFVGAGYYK